MRPNTPHYVLTPKAAICYGGHFYAMSTIRDTVFGAFHMFALSKSITNTEHSDASHLLFRRLIVYAHHVLVREQFDSESTAPPTPHVPDARTLEGTLDLFFLCIVAELGELLDPTAYKKRRRDSREFEHGRLCTIYTRGLARELLKWWRTHFWFVKDKVGFVDGEVIFQQLLVHQVKTLAAYKEGAERQGMEAEEPACTAAAFQSLAKKYLPFLYRTSVPEGASLQNFDWQATGYMVKARSGIQVTKPSSSESPFDRFCTYVRIMNLNALKLKAS
jgi:hypothetical protein